MMNLSSLRRLCNPILRRTGVCHQAACFSSVDIMHTRNIGISAHIDSGKTTLTERILFYTGKIQEIHDVRGKDGVGAKMDSMDLEREKGITIKSAATYCKWGKNHINIIDTPGHVDFTIEVERALRVLDGAILVICGVSGVQSQTLTVDRQMKRYQVPRVAFINKLDRMGANPWKAIDGLRADLRLSAAAVQIPIGLEAAFDGVIDIIDRQAVEFHGVKGTEIRRAPVPAEFTELCEEKRKELVERLAEVDDEIAELFIGEVDPTPEQLRKAIRTQTIARKFVPVFMGSAYKNKGVQLLLDGVNHFLPSPKEVENLALDLDKGEAEVSLLCDALKPFVALAFKLEESRFGQLTYLRLYQGTLKKGMTVVNVTNGKKVKVPRLVRMHSDEMEDIESASAGDVLAVFGVECASMDTFTDGSVNYSLMSMFVPKPVMSISVKPKESQMMNGFSKAIGKFSREDPTLRIAVDPKTKETIMSGMGELHLEIYVERMKREYNVECITGSPAVNYKETISAKSNFSYLHKKQSGGSGQYARVIGYIEPLDEEELKKGIEFEFENRVVGTNIPPEYIPSCEKGARAACEKGVLAGYPLTGVRVVVTDGQAHAVDSNDLSFQLAMQYALRQGVKAAKPIVLEPVMSLEVSSPAEFQGTIIGGLNKRNGLIMSTDLNEDGSQVAIKADVPLAVMFGYSTDIRSSTQGKGEFSMEYKQHLPVSKESQENLVKIFASRISDEPDWPAILGRMYDFGSCALKSTNAWLMSFSIYDIDFAVNPKEDSIPIQVCIDSFTASENDNDFNKYYNQKLSGTLYLVDWLGNYQQISKIALAISELMPIERNKEKNDEISRELYCVRIMTVVEQSLSPDALVFVYQFQCDQDDENINTINGILAPTVALKRLGCPGCEKMMYFRSFCYSCGYVFDTVVNTSKPKNINAEITESKFDLKRKEAVDRGLKNLIRNVKQNAGDILFLLRSIAQSAVGKVKDKAIQYCKEAAIRFCDKDMLKLDTATTGGGADDEGDLNHCDNFITGLCVIKDMQENGFGVPMCSSSSNKGKRACDWAAESAGRLAQKPRSDSQSQLSSSSSPYNQTDVDEDEAKFQKSIKKCRVNSRILEIAKVLRKIRVSVLDSTPGRKGLTPSRQILPTVCAACMFCSQCRNEDKDCEIKEHKPHKEMLYQNDLLVKWLMNAFHYRKAGMMNVEFVDDRYFSLLTMLKFLPAIRLYAPRERLSLYQFEQQCYLVTHVIYLFSEYGKHSLKRHLFAEEFYFIKYNMFEAAGLQNTRQGLKIVGEFLHCLKILQYSPEHDEPDLVRLVQDATRLLLRGEHQLRGEWICSDDSYERYHSSYCGTVGLMDCAFADQENPPVPEVFTIVLRELLLV